MNVTTKSEPRASLLINRLSASSMCHLFLLQTITLGFPARIWQHYRRVWAEQSLIRSVGCLKTCRQMYLSQRQQAYSLICRLSAKTHALKHWIRRVITNRTSKTLLRASKQFFSSERQTSASRSSTDHGTCSLCKISSINVRRTSETKGTLTKSILRCAISWTSRRNTRLIREWPSNSEI